MSLLHRLCFNHNFDINFSFVCILFVEECFIFSSFTLYLLVIIISSFFSKFFKKNIFKIMVV